MDTHGQTEENRDGTDSGDPVGHSVAGSMNTIHGNGGPYRRRLGFCRYTITYLSIMAFFALSFFLAPAMLPHGYVSEIGEEGGNENNANHIDFSDNWSTMADDGHYYQAAIYYFGDFNCHQLPERSYKINGNQQPVCSRDVGMFLGGTLGALALVAVVPLPEVWPTMLTILPGRGEFLTRRMKPFFAVATMAFILMAPLVADGSYQLATPDESEGGYESNNPMRMITGICFGFGFFYGLGAVMASSVYGLIGYPMWDLPGGPVTGRESPDGRTRYHEHDDNTSQGGHENGYIGEAGGAPEANPSEKPSGSNRHENSR